MSRAGLFFVFVLVCSFSSGSSAAKPEKPEIKAPATDCDAATYTNAFAPSCANEEPPNVGDDKSFPYCVSTSLTDPTQGECRQCLSECDCPLDQYCSRDSGQEGMCVKFLQVGKPCLPYNNNELLDKDLNDDLKCAALFSTNGNLVIDHAGGCINKVCQYCTPNSNPGLVGLCGFGSTPYGGGTKAQYGRVCSYPGVAVEYEQFAWAEGNFHYNVSAVWAAVVFFFFLLVAGCQLVQCILTIIGGGAVLYPGGSGGGAASQHATAASAHQTEAKPE